MNNNPKRVYACLIALCLGWIGGHHFYLRRYNVAILWLLASVLLCWTVVVPLFLWVVGALQGIVYLLQTKESWDKQFIK